MQRINIVALKTDRAEIIKRLQELGVVELSLNFDKLRKKVRVRRKDTSSARAQFEKNATQADQAIEILDKYVPEKGGLSGIINGKPFVDNYGYNRIDDDQKYYKKQASEIVALEKDISQANADIARCENQIEMLAPWMGLDVPMNTQGTQKTVVLIGMIPEGIDASAIEAKLKAADKPGDRAEITVISKDKDASYVAVTCLKEDLEAIEEGLRSIGFAKPSYLSAHEPAEEKNLLLDEIEKCKKIIEENEKAIADHASSRADLKILSDFYRLKADRYAKIAELPQTKKTFGLSGYIPAPEAARVAKEIEDKYAASVEVLELKPKAKPPVLLKNNWFSQATEGITASYGMPSKGEFDPTLIMSFFYVILFGMMLSDAGYGLIMVVALGIILIKGKTMDPGLKKTLKMFWWGGLSTFVWGLLFGGFFGDAIGIFSGTFGDGSVAFHGFWFEPIGQPMRLLMYCLIIGLIHLFFGLGLNGYLMLKKKNVVGFICDVIAWYLFLIGLIIMLLGSSLFASMATGTEFANIHISPAMNTAGMVLAIIGGVIILVMAGLFVISAKSR